MIRAPDLGDPVLGHDEDLLRLGREAALKRRATSRMSSRCSRWSSPDRHLVGAVGEHVGRLEHRVEEQPRGDQLALGDRLVAELVHAG